jgi:hypothetical protein
MTAIGAARDMPRKPEEFPSFSCVLHRAATIIQLLTHLIGLRQPSMTEISRPGSSKQKQIPSCTYLGAVAILEDMAITGIARKPRSLEKPGQP